MATIVGNVNQDELDQENQQPGQTQVGSTITPTSATSSQSTTQQFNQNQQPQRQIGSGRFTNIQQYLGANRQAGQQLGQTLQKGIGQKFGQAQATSGRELGEAQQQQQSASNLYNQGIQQYQQLGGQKAVADVAAAPIQGAIQQQQYQAPGAPIQQQAPAQQDAMGQQKITVAPPAPPSAPKGTLASEYTANIGSRQQAALDIAKDQEALQRFTGLRTGTAQQEQAALIRKQTDEARMAAEALKRQHEQRMQQLATETGRTGLLGEFAGGRDYTGAKRSLDLAFLQKDPGKALDVLKQNIGAKRSDVQSGLQNVGSAEQQEQLLNTRGTALAQNLAEQTQQNVGDYVANLEDRINIMEQQRGQKMDWARKQLEDFKGGKALNREFLDLMGIDKGTQLFNVIKDTKDVGDILDVANLNKQLNLEDVSTEQDVANYDAFAKLAGLSPDAYQVAKSTADLKDISGYASTDAKNIQNQLKAAKAKFINDAAKRVITGASQWEAGHKNFASQNLLDFLTGNQTIGNEMVTRGNEFTGRNLGALSQQWDKFDRQYNIGGNMMEQAGIMGWSPGREAGRTFSDTIQKHEGGDAELAANLALDFFNPGTYVGGGAIGEAFDNLGGVAKDFVSNLANTLGMGGGNDDYKGAGYARNRSLGYLENELASALMNSGFYNVMGDQGSQTIEANKKGTWDGNTWYAPGQDLAKFGYGRMDLSRAGTYNPNARADDIMLSPLERPVAVSANPDRMAALQQLAATGQLSDEDFLENTPSVT